MFTYVNTVLSGTIQREGGLGLVCGCAAYISVQKMTVQPEVWFIWCNAPEPSVTVKWLHVYWNEIKLFVLLQVKFWHESLFVWTWWNNTLHGIKRAMTVFFSHFIGTSFRRCHVVLIVALLLRYQAVRCICCRSSTFLQMLCTTTDNYQHELSGAVYLFTLCQPTEGMRNHHLIRSMFCNYTNILIYI